MKKELPLLLTPAQVRKLIGKVPRSLTNMVVCDPKHNPPRRLYLRSEVMRHVG